jgi:alanine racemase
MSRWAWAEVDSSAISHNISVISERVSPSQVWAVVKANGYGHGAVLTALAALEGGARGLCVALVQEGLELRAAGIDAPIMVLSEQPCADVADALAAGLILSVYSSDAVEAIASCGGGPHSIQVKVDTGMHRVGCRPQDALSLARSIVQHENCELFGTYTHLAAADEPDEAFTDVQLDRFDAVLADFAAAGIDPGVVHAANSAGALAHPRARHHLVRVGIAGYGLLPSRDVAHLCTDLQPALSLHARVSWVQRVSAGERISYGLRHRFANDSTVATVPIGYADGVPRRSAAVGGTVLIGGRRRPIVGVVTMDQLMVDCGDDSVSVGDEVVLIGQQGQQRITADDWAEALSTIGYEVVCAIGRRIERRAHP